MREWINEREREWMEEWKRARGIMDEWAIRRDKERKKVEKKMQQMKHTYIKREIIDELMNQENEWNNEREREGLWMNKWERNTDRIE